MTQTADRIDYESALRAARETVALARPPGPGILRMTGEDALDLLDRLSTNAVGENPSGFGVSTVLTTNKGRVVDLLTVIYRSDHWLVMTSPGQQQRVVDWIDEFTFGEEIELEDVTDEMSVFTLVGPKAAEVLQSVAEADAAKLLPHHSIETSVAGTEALILRAGPVLGEAFDLLVSAGAVESVSAALLEKGVAFGIREMDSVTYEAFRVEAGFPVHGAEIGEDVNPLEAGLWDAVNFSKGCYVGQEVVARLNTYEKVKRYLAKLSLEDGPIPDAGTSLTVGGKEAGKITSVSPVAISGRRAVLGYVRKKYAEAGTMLTAETEQGGVGCKFVERVGRRDEG